MIADAAPRHPGEALLDHLAHPALARVVPAGEQEIAARGVRKLGRGPEAAVADIEEAGQLAGCLIENGRRDLPGLRLGQRLRDLLADRLGAFRHTRAVSPVPPGGI